LIITIKSVKAPLSTQKVYKMMHLARKSKNDKEITITKLKKKKKAFEMLSSIKILISKT
jgi:hypothetical protein